MNPDVEHDSCHVLQCIFHSHLIKGTLYIANLQQNFDVVETPLRVSSTPGFIKSSCVDLILTIIGSVVLDMAGTTKLPIYQSNLIDVTVLNSG